MLANITCCRFCVIDITQSVHCCFCTFHFSRILASVLLKWGKQRGKLCVNNFSLSSLSLSQLTIPSHNESGVSFAVLKVFVLITRIMKGDSSETVISVVKHAPLSLFCRPGGVADPRVEFCCSCCALKVLIWTGWMQKVEASRCWIRFHTHRLTQRYCMFFNTIHFPLSLRGHRYTLNGPLWWYTLWLGST